MNASVHIHVAAGIVTGSCRRLVPPGGELLVDCGMSRGPKSVRSLNYRYFPFDTSAIEAILLNPRPRRSHGPVPQARADRLTRRGVDDAKPRATSCTGCLRLPDPSRRTTSID